MRTIAISINKGGMGKTMLTKTIATAATEAGLAVLILDMDTQENAANWGRRRIEKQGKELPLAKFTTENGLAGELKRAEAAGCDLVLIDTPPGRNSEAPAAVEAADLVLIPFWNDQDAYDGVAKTAGLARRMGKTAYGVLNHSVPNSRVHEDTAREVLGALGLPMSPVVFHRYDVHRVSTVQGLTAQEIEPNSNAAVEIKQFWNWICATVQIGTSAPVHKKAKVKVAS